MSVNDEEGKVDQDALADQWAADMSDGDAPGSPVDPGSPVIVLASTVEDRNPLDTDLTMGWKEHATDGVKVYDLAGNHDTWLVNYASEFGDLLDSILTRVRVEQKVTLSENAAAS